MNSKQIFVDLLHEQLFWFREQRILGNLHVRAPLSALIDCFFLYMSISTCGCRGRCCSVNVTYCCFNLFDLMPHTSLLNFKEPFHQEPLLSGNIPLIYNSEQCLCEENCTNCIFIPPLLSPKQMFSTFTFTRCRISSAPGSFCTPAPSSLLAASISCPPWFLIKHNCCLWFIVTCHKDRCMRLHANAV